MARIRTIKPEFPQSESMGQCSRNARLTFLLLFTLADDAGRLRGNSRMLSSVLFPYDDDSKKQIESWLNELEQVECIERYQVDGDSYLVINKWSLHQKIDRPTPSKIPPPAERALGVARTREDSHRAEKVTSADGMVLEGNGRECIAGRREAARFDEFWKTWPKSERKQDKAKCREKWAAKNLDQIVDLILADLATKKTTQKWQGGFIEAPEVYLSNRRWEDGVTPDEIGSPGVLDPDSRASVEAEGVEKGVGVWNEGLEQWHVYKAKVRGRSPGLIGLAQLGDELMHRSTEKSTEKSADRSADKSADRSHLLEPIAPRRIA